MTSYSALLARSSTIDAHLFTFLLLFFLCVFLLNLAAHEGFCFIWFLFLLFGSSAWEGF